MSAIILHRIDPARHMRRYYRLDVCFTKPKWCVEVRSISIVGS